ncbi:MAG: 2-dehydropantoate 2-reductase, partial [Cellvibrionales bacterium]|nr:2-dehydropantoate 2-reductase [Cellvibrionales bacterium]
YFNQAGLDITLIRKHASADKRATITLTRQGKIFAAEVTQTSAKHLKTVDILLITTKTYDTTEALASIDHAINDNTLIIICQNGIEHYRIIDRFPNNTIYAAVCFEGVKKSAPLTIEHTGIGFTDLGLLRDKASSIDLNSLTQTQLMIRMNNYIEQLIWKKLIANSCINPLTVYFDCLNGKLLNLAPAMDYIHQLIDEAMPVMQDYRIDIPSKELKRYCIDGIKKTAHNSSSMREDIHQHRQTEIDAINGFILHSTKHLAKAAKTHQHLVDFIIGCNPSY